VIDPRRRKGFECVVERSALFGEGVLEVHAERVRARRRTDTDRAGERRPAIDRPLELDEACVLEAPARHELRPQEHDVPR
jgi:hypothetical protein